jgi:uncharacterized membrane protein required for colicin V production
MNWLDLVLGLLFVIALAGGYLQGVIRQALSLGAIVSGLILATYIHVPLAAFYDYIFPEVRAATTETAAFLTAVVVLISALEAIQRKAMPDTHLLAIGVLDRIAGVLVAVPAAAFQMGVAIIVLRFVLSARWPVGETARLILVAAEESSFLAPNFANLVLTLVTVVGRMLPEGGPRFLRLR